MRHIAAVAVLLCAALAAGCGSSSGLDPVSSQAGPGAVDCDVQRLGAGPSYCERRDFVDRATTGTLAVSSRNGDVAVAGESRSTVTLLAYVYATAATQERAKEIVAQVEIQTLGENYYATGPQTTGAENWGVSFDAALPSRVNLTASSTNGDVGIAGIGGGRLRGESTNGSYDVTLSGSHWDGGDVSLGATNGNLTFHVPGAFAAQFSMRATNGDIQSDFAGGTHSSSSPTQNEYELTLNGGGASMSGTITNGNGYIRRRV